MAKIKAGVKAPKDKPAKEETYYFKGFLVSEVKIAVEGTSRTNALDKAKRKSAMSITTNVMKGEDVQWEITESHLEIKDVKDDEERKPKR